MHIPPSQPLTQADIEAIERATLAAVAPRAIDTMSGWLLPYDQGPIQRARAAVPLAHDACDPALVPKLQVRYAAQGLPLLLRLPDVPAFARLQDALTASGFAATRETRVQIAQSRQVCAISTATPAHVMATADEAWASGFLGPGFDPDEGALRVQSLTRARDSLFARVEESGQTVAVGVLGPGAGWAGIHGMRTSLAQRGKGYAARILATLAGAALERGIERVFLQVEAGNDPALRLYRRAGFATAWCYQYWSRRLPD